MGPQHLLWQLPMASQGPVPFFVSCCRCPRMGPLHLLQLSPIASFGPITFLQAADGLGLAHCICCSCRRWLHLGPWLFWEVLLMPKDRPTAFAAAVANGFIWAHCFSGRCCRCPRMGPLHLQQLSPMALFGPITFPGGAVDAVA